MCQDGLEGTEVQRLKVVVALWVGVLMLVGCGTVQQPAAPTKTPTSMDQTQGQAPASTLAQAPAPSPDSHPGGNCGGNGEDGPAVPSEEALVAPPPGTLPFQLHFPHGWKVTTTGSGDLSVLHPDGFIYPRIGECTSHRRQSCAPIYRPIGQMVHGP